MLSSSLGEAMILILTVVLAIVRAELAAGNCYVHFLLYQALCSIFSISILSIIWYHTPNVPRKILVKYVC